MTKNILTTVTIVLLISLLIFSCGAPEDTSLNGKKASAKEILKEIKELQINLDSLNVQIKDLEGVKEVKKTLITIFAVTEKPFAAFVEVQGTSQAENNVNLTTDIGGLVTKVFVDEGQYVSKGKTLIRLDNTVMQSQLNEINTSLSLAKEIFDKRKRLWEKNIGSEIEFLQAKNNYNSLLAKKQTLNVSMRKANIKAPISGKVDNIFLKVGELASPGMPAVNIVNLRNMEVHVSVPETYLGKIKKGNKVMVSFPTLKREVEATVKSVSQSINRNNRTFTVVASISNKGGALKPNLLAKVKINNEAIEKAIAIPSNLIQKSPKGFYVYTVENDKDGHAQAKELAVEVGTSYKGMIVITKGLAVGQQLIKEGFRDVLNGDLVEIAE
tara:strand:+ start:289 stop:1440 length:1152 start_codon:yes stop_codon:yes gene_type:complete